MTPLHGIACFCDIGFGARAVSRKTPIYFSMLMFFPLWAIVNDKTRLKILGAFAILMMLNNNNVVLTQGWQR